MGRFQDLIIIVLLFAFGVALFPLLNEAIAGISTTQPLQTILQVIPYLFVVGFGVLPTVIILGGRD